MTNEFKEKHKKEIEEINNQFEELIKDDEIKEILEDNGELMVRYKDNSFECFDTLPQNVLDYITTLQEENKELKLLSMTQNNREYRSKFLKEYQKEHGKHCYPDYDEIYKRYDKLKEENEKLNNIINELEKYIGAWYCFDNESAEFAVAKDILDKLEKLKEGKK